MSLRNVSQQAYQQINPRWAQSFTMELDNGFLLRDGNKFVAQSKFFFPGISKNHSLEFDLGYQIKDTSIDYFKKTFPYSRGYEAISTSRMYKMGVNYHFTLLYPDFGFANLLYIQRVRATLFFDYTYDKISSQEKAIKNRSLGTEIYFDTKIWNSFPITFGLRYSYLKDRDVNHPKVKNKWEFVIPISFIPD